MKSSSILLVDIGNTSISIGVGHGKRLENTLRLDTKQCSATTVKKAISKAIQRKKIHGAVLCSVVPELTELWKRTIVKTCRIMPLIVHNRLKLGIHIDYPKPSSIGADRIANACGAVYRYGTPAIVIDFGTALTFDVVSKDNKYIGGVIAPGLPLMTDYLAEKTALLPHIELRDQCSKIGRSTEGAMRIGAHVGYRGIVREVIMYLKQNLDMKKVHLCATGGYAKWVLKGLNMPFKFDPNLTLYGLMNIWELNTKVS
ncbi:type III pantothenate kinase [Verrucomicrobiota bacterium]